MKLTLNSAALRAAMTFKAKDDIRQQLNCVNIYNGKLIGSNGHVACMVPHDGIDGVSGVLVIDKLPPATAEKSEIDGDQVIHFDAKGTEKARSAATFMGQLSAIDFEQVIPVDYVVEPYGFNLAPDYLGLIAKAFPRPKKAGYYAAKLVHSTPTNFSAPCVIEVKSSTLPKGEAIVFIGQVKE